MKLTRADVQAMNESELSTAFRLINEEVETREEGGFAEVVCDFLRDTRNSELRLALAAAGGAPVRLSFTSDHWDNGYFYSESTGVLTFDDDSTMDVDFDGTVVEDALSELSQIRRGKGGLDEHSVLKVDLVTGAVEHTIKA
jgi:hypothetical protein